MATIDDIMSPLASMLSSKPILDETTSVELNQLKSDNLLTIEKHIATTLARNPSVANAELALLLRQVAGTYR